MDWWIIAAGFALVLVARLLGQRWFVGRWLANGMSSTRAAVLSIAVTQVPLLAAILTFVWLSGSGTSLADLAFLTALLLLPSLMWFGLRRAVFEYMDQHGVRDELKRQRKQ